MAVAFASRKPNLPSLPREQPPEVPERIIERHIVERVQGVRGRDGRDGKDARPSHIYYLRVVYRRDAVHRNDFVRESITPQRPEDLDFCEGIHIKGEFLAPALLRATLGHDIMDEAVVGQRVCLIQKGGMVVSMVAPKKISPRVRSSISLITLTMTLEAFDD